MAHAHRRNVISVLFLTTVIWAGHAFAGSTPNAVANNAVASAMAAASAAAAGKASESSESSACAKQCFLAAQTLGFDKVSGDSLACVMPYKGKRMSTYDCCDKAELLLGAHGALANCLCCREFAKAMLDAVPYAELGTTAKDYLEKLHLCRVPILGQSTCLVRPPLERAFVSNQGSAGGNGSASAAQASLQPKPLIEAFNLTGLYPWVGFDARFDPGLLAAQGQAAVAAGQINRITVVGASPLYNDYITGFVMWIEKNTPRYNTPKLPELPPLPEQYKEDIAWVANLRRGPYPDLIKNRPAAFAPKATDPLQNGEISNLPPGPAFAGRLAPLMSKAPAPPSSP